MFAELPNATDESVKLVNKTQSSVFIEWQHISGIPEHLKDFYGYQIEYKEATTEANYTVLGVLSYKSDPQWMLENLKVKTTYLIKVTPFRKYDKMKELASPYNILRVETEGIGKLNERL